MSAATLSRRHFLQNGTLGATLLAGSSAAWGAGEKAAEKPSSLTITKVETFVLKHKLPNEIGVSTLLYGFRDALIIKITTDSGLVGWGETSDVGGTRGIIEDHLKPILLGKNPLEYRSLWRSLWGPFFGDGRAVGGVEIAIQDLRGKALGMPVCEVLGGRVRDKVMAYASAMAYTAGVDPEDQFPPEAAGLAKQGFRAMKVRTGRFAPKRDLAVLAKIREAVGPNVRLLTDGNGAFTFPQAMKFGKELEKLDFYFFEEPLPEADYVGYDELTDQLDIAIAGGEGLDSRGMAKELIERRAVDIIQPDATLCGGIGEALFVAEMARVFGMLCIPHCWSGAIALAATLHTNACIPNFTWGHTSDEPMLEMDTYENPFREEIVATPFRIKDGYVDVPKAPGLGVEVDEEVIRKYLVK